MDFELSDEHKALIQSTLDEELDGFYDRMLEKGRQMVKDAVAQKAQLDADAAAAAEDWQHGPPKYRSAPRCWSCHELGHTRYWCPSWKKCPRPKASPPKKGRKVYDPGPFVDSTSETLPSKSNRDYMSTVDCYRCGQLGHFWRDCTTILDHSNKNYFRPSTSRQFCKRGQRADPANLIGSVPEAKVAVNGIETTALLDTGATISTVSETFYKEYLQHLPIHPVQDILRIECADGSPLPYSGYIEVDLVAPCVSEESAPILPSLLLVVPGNSYSQRVPLLLGTNVLEPLMQRTRNAHGSKFLQNASLQVPWYLSFRCISVQEKDLQRNHNRLGVVKSALQEPVYIKPNSSATITSFVDHPLDYKPTSAMMQPLLNDRLASLVDIFPTVVNFQGKKTGLVDVKVDNLTTQTVVIPSRATLCELQPVTRLLSKPREEDSEATADAVLSKMSLDSPLLDDREKEILTTKLKSHLDKFSTSDLDMGHHTRVQHEIHLTDEHPFKERHRRIPPGMLQQVREHLQQMLDSGIIRPSQSPWSSEVVWVRKKDGSLRQCVDYRRLNARTIKDSYCLPRIEEILDSLAGAKYFSVLDLKSGYHQVEIAEHHKERTAFSVAPLGFFEYNRMAMGLANAPATYQRLMESVLGDLHLTICMVFLDDIIVYGNSFEEHLDRLERVLLRLGENGLKLNPKKCSFFQERVRYVGHIVSAQGIETDPEKTEKVRNWPRPQTPEEVRRFLGFCGYYRRFVKDFSKIARPLNDLMPAPNKKKSKKSSPSSERKKWHWGDEQESAFQTLKARLTAPPILAFADYSKPFELHCDASGCGLGGVLYQEQDGQKRVIAYASRGLSKSEANYPAHKLEFLALKWSITEKFHDYLFGHKFTVFTDNNPLTYVLTSARLDATGHRWLAALSAYDFDILYKPGANNSDADGLSRLPTAPDRAVDCHHIPVESVEQVCKSSQAKSYVEGLAFSAGVVDDSFDPPGQVLHRLSDRQIINAQRNDPALGLWLEALENNSRPMKDIISSTAEGATHRSLFQVADKLSLIDGKLYREVESDDRTIKQLVLPRCYISEVFKLLHTNIGHPGRDRTLSLLRDRFYWPGMYSDVERMIEGCSRCIRRKAPDQRRVPLVNIKTTHPLELVCMDFLTLESSKGGYQHILVITDHFTRFATAIPTKNQTAKTTADALFNGFIVHYGIPKKLHSDQGANFESKLIRELCTVMGCDKSRTTPYHPMGNGMTERYNRTLLSMLGTLEPHQKADWKSYVAPLVHAYNCTRHESTQFSPYSLMFGRDPNLPVDLTFGLTEDQPAQPLTKYVDNLRNRLKESFKLATANADRARRKQKAHYDLKSRPIDLLIEDRVLVKKVAFGEGKHKLADHWDEEVYKVVSRPNADIPVFVVEGEKSGKRRTLHKNLLLPLGNRLLDEKSKDPVQTPVRRRKSRRHHQTSRGTDSESGTEGSDISSGAEDLVVEPTTNSVDGNVASSRNGSSGAGGDAHDLPEGQREPEGDQPDNQDDGISRDLTSPPVNVEPQQQPAATVDNGVVETHREQTDRHASVDTEATSVKQPIVAPANGPVPMPRQSARQRSQPVWMADYVLSQQSRLSCHAETQTECMEASKRPDDALDEAIHVLDNMPDSVVSMYLRCLLSKFGTKL